jgi:hypothetical protein
MTQLTLLTKAYNAYQLKQVDRLLKAKFEGLNVEAKIEGVAADKWVQLALSGEDEAIATSYIRKEIGFCPTSMENVERFAKLKGYIVELGKSPDELHLDIGVFQPETAHVTIQAELADGRRLALKKIAELFGFCEGLPLDVNVTVVNRVEKSMEAELATRQIKRFTFWQESLLDRLIVLRSPLHEVKKMLNFTGLNRDIIGIESLGLFEHALTCKLGTDAAGLISQVGRNLRNARFAVFNPRRIRNILGT